MHIVVCMKQVPDSAQIRVHPVTNTIMRQGVPTIINPYDLFAIEEALRLRDQFGGEVTVLTMGPPSAEDSLRKALSFGVDRAVLLTDRFFAGADTLATTYALATALRKIGVEFGAPDIVFTGKQTIDGDTAQVGPGVAKRLEFIQLTYVSKINSVDTEKRLIEVERRAEGGVQQLQSSLPCLITILEGVNEIRCRFSDGRVESRSRQDREMERAGSWSRGYHQMRASRFADDRQEGLCAAAAGAKGRADRSRRAAGRKHRRRAVPASTQLESELEKLARGF